MVTQYARPALDLPAPGAMHDLVIAELQHSRYHPMVQLLLAHRDAEIRPAAGPVAVAWTDPVGEAAQHLVAALVALRRAVLERQPGARLTYQALLVVVGGLARRWPVLVATKANQLRPAPTRPERRPPLEH